MLPHPSPKISCPEGLAILLCYSWCQHCQMVLAKAVPLCWLRLQSLATAKKRHFDWWWP